MQKTWCNPITTIFFDLGSTLVYYDAGWPASMTDVLDPLTHSLLNSGYHFEEQVLRKLVTQQIIFHEPQASDQYREPEAAVVLEQILRELCDQSVEEKPIRTALRAMYQVAETHWTPEPETLAVIKELKSCGLQIGIISNAADHEDLEHIIDKTGIRPYLDDLVSSAQFGFGKPSPLIFEHALERLHTDAGSAVMVGDKLEADILGAAQVGIRSIWITRRARKVDLDTVDPIFHPWRIVESLAEIPPLLIS